MGEREERRAAAGCVLALIGAGVGFGVWLRGARPGVRGAFEGERDGSLLYADLPVMAFGFPAAALAVWALTCAALRGRVRRWTVGVVSGAVVVLTLAGLAWAGSAWLEVRVEGWVGEPGARGVTGGVVGG